MSNTVRTISSANRPRRLTATSAAGYTLLELMLVVVIVALLGTLIGPTFQDSITRNRQQGALGDMFGMLGTARTEAVNLQSTVTACPSTDQDTCAGNNWETGWILFVDDGNGGGTAGDGDRQAAEVLIRVGQAGSGDMTIRSRNFNDAGAISFNQEGFADERGTVVICSGDAENASAIILNLSGQARLGVDEDGNGTIDEDDGTEIAECP